MRGRTIRKRVHDPEAGWTFVEVIVVLAIILILGATISIIAFSYIGKSNVAAAKTQMQSYQAALNEYAYDCGRFPTTEQGLAALWTKPTSGPQPVNYKGPYLEKAPVNDPWGHPYKYVVPGPNGLPFAITSLGADGVEGGSGEDADISSYQ